MSIWSLNSLQQHHRRKVVPEGSNDFQRVLDEILYSEDIEDTNVKESDVDQQKDLKCVQQNNKYTNCDDQQGIDQYKDNRSLTNDILVFQPDNIDHDNNNNSSIFAVAYELDKCQYCQDSELDVSSTTSPYNVVVNSSLEQGATETENSKNKNVRALRESEHQKLKMGTSCSSNFYDNREWHNVKGENNIDSLKPRKRGRLLKKRSSNDRTAEQTKEPKALFGRGDENDTEKSPVASTVCNCHHQECSTLETEQPARPLNFHANDLKNNTHKRVSLSPDDIFELNNLQLTSNRLSPNVDSSGHVQVSRVVGSGRARATTDCDVSPHRLLTRRSISPKSNPTSLDEKSTDSTYNKERQRSHSWSNGKLGTKDNFKTNSLTVPSSHANPAKSHEIKSSQTLTDRASCPVMLTKAGVHDTECPQHIKSEEISITPISKASAKSQQDNLDTDLAPISRRRAASESQTMRTLRRLPRTPDSSDQIQEHVRVRWADEKKGSSLSTSVFLSSIRPRSHSYGAMDSVPHRPILKKGQAFNL